MNRHYRPTGQSSITYWPQTFVDLCQRISACANAALNRPMNSSAQLEALTSQPRHKGRFIIVAPGRQPLLSRCHMGLRPISGGGRQKTVFAGATILHGVFRPNCLGGQWASMIANERPRGPDACKMMETWCAASTAQAGAKNPFCSHA